MAGNEPGIAHPATLAALGVLAYVTETMLHEAAGHGTVCLMTGGSITVVAPLFMRCSVQTVVLNLAGPAANVLAALGAYAALRRFSQSAGPFRFFIWLSFVFNALVAAGYLMVGAVTGFGDWSVIFGSVYPALLWKLPATAAGLFFYIVALRYAGFELGRMTGIGIPVNRDLRQLVLVPTGAAAFVAVAAEIVGQGAQLPAIALALGCTLVVGLLLLRLGSRRFTATIASSALQLKFHWPPITLATLVAAGFVFVIGPGVDLSSMRLR